MLEYLRNEDGFLSVHIMTLGAVGFLVLMFVFTSLFISMDTRGTETYNWFKSSLEFATYTANLYGDMSEVAAGESSAKQYFIKVFGEITDCAPSGDTFVPASGSYPGPIALKSFKTVAPGEEIPYGTANMPGYMAEIEVPVFGGNVPLLGPKYVTFPMKYYTAAVPADIH